MSNERVHPLGRAGWLRDPDSRPSFVDVVERVDEMVQDPLRYILTTVLAAGSLSHWMLMGLT